VQFGVSTQFVHAQRLQREHLAAIRAHGFDAVEIVATRSHVDFHSAAALDEVAGWLTAEGLRLHSLHAPMTERFTGRWIGPFNNASAQPLMRERAVRETLAALGLAARVPVSVLVLHVGLPDSLLASADENNRDAARRSVETIAEAAGTLGVRVALEVIPNALSTPESLVALVEDELDLPGVGICLDLGHAHMMGDLVESIDTVSGSLIATHVHDNHGTRDEHLLPFDGTIDWPAAIIALQKIGYEGTMVLELAGADDPAPTLARARDAQSRLQELATGSWS
jgi:sugar phosphate isomerase/epimerase